MTRKSRSPAISVFYDGDCPRCRRLAARYSRLDERERIQWLDFNTRTKELADAGLDRASALQRLHSVSADGEIKGGAEALAEIWDAIPRRRALARLMRIPVFAQIVAWVYRYVARRRKRES